MLGGSPEISADIGSCLTGFVQVRLGYCAIVRICGGPVVLERPVPLLICDRSFKCCVETLANKARVALYATCVAPVRCANLRCFFVERVKPRATTGVRGWERTRSISIGSAIRTPVRFVRFTASEVPAAPRALALRPIPSYFRIGWHIMCLGRIVSAWWLPCASQG